MSKSDMNLQENTTNTDVASEIKTDWRSVGYAIVFGLIGALMNTQTVAFLPDLHLILGNMAFVMIAMRFSPVNAVLCALITVSPLYFIFGHPFGFITFGLAARRSDRTQG